MEEVNWAFDYEGKHFENILRDANLDGDFRLIQNNSSLYMMDPGERYFLPMIIYGMQKMSSFEEAKENLNEKDWIKGLDSRVHCSNHGASGYFFSVFDILNEVGEYRLSDEDLTDCVVRVNGGLKVSQHLNEEIIFPYEELSTVVDKLIISSKKKLFRTSHKDISKMIGYYVSGKFERDYFERY